MQKQELRLNKALASAGVCSRRKADELIFSGAVTVNGQRITEPGTRISPDTDTVCVDGRTLRLSTGAEAEKHTYVLLHKPVQVVSTANDPQGRTTVLDLLPMPYKTKRMYPVGRLDYFSEGLLLLTDDGELTHRLTHPRYHLPKEYEVTVREDPDMRMFALMEKGMTLAEGEKLAPVGVRTLAHTRKTFFLTLHQGINRQIRRMCRDLGLTILRLRRIQIGPIALDGLEKGKCRLLEKQEVAQLRQAAGLSPEG